MKRSTAARSSPRTSAPADTGNLHAAARERAVAKILKAGELVFGRLGFDGATTAEVAREAGVPKATLHYYFNTKEDLHRGVLDRILEIWAGDLEEISAQSEPAYAIGRYIERKMRHSRQYPELTRLWTIEVLSGARRIEPFVRIRTREIIEAKETVIKGWIEAGKMAPVDAKHLFFMIWAATQTYAETEAQMAMILGKDALDADVFETATRTVSDIILKGLGLSR